MAGISLIRAGVAALTLAAAAPALADTADAVNDVIVPAYDALASSTEALAAAAKADCSPEALAEPYQAAWDAWARIGFLRLGPVEDDGRSLAIAFWPDPKGSGARAQASLIKEQSDAIDDPATFAGLSVAMRGLTGLERLLFYAPEPEGDADYRCRLVQATASDLARMADETRDGWNDYAKLLIEPGSEGNTTFLSPDEARQALYTQLMTGLEFVKDQRLGRPLGTFDKPRPERAEALAAGRSQRNVELSLTGLRDLALALAPDSPLSTAAFDHAIGLAQDLGDPVFAGVADPQGRLKVEILQQAVTATRDTVQGEIGDALDLDVGFNAADGD